MFDYILSLFTRKKRNDKRKATYTSASDDFHLFLPTESSSANSSSQSKNMIWINGSQLSNIPTNTKTEIIKNFLATVDDEVSVPKGSIVAALYKDTTKQWIFIQRADGQQGYVPDFVCNLLVSYSNLHQLPERSKISRRKSQQIKSELKKFHKREFEKRADQLMVHCSTLPTKITHTKNVVNRLPSKIETTNRRKMHENAKIILNNSKICLSMMPQPLPTKCSQTLERMAPKNFVHVSNNVRHLKRTSINSFSNQQEHLTLNNGLVTLERAKPRRMPTLTERQITMNENLKRFLESLPPCTFENNHIQDSYQNFELLCAEGKNINYDAKKNTKSNPNLTKIDSNEVKRRKVNEPRRLCLSNPNIALNENSMKRLKSIENNTNGKIVWRPAEPSVKDYMAIKNFTPETKIDLKIQKGDRITTVFNVVNGWLWASHTESKAQGFVPITAVTLIEK